MYKDKTPPDTRLQPASRWAVQHFGYFTGNEYV